MNYSFWHSIAGAAKADVVVLIARTVVQIQGKNTCIGAVVPIATTEKAA